jgi:hypothetical protein
MLTGDSFKARPNQGFYAFSKLPGVIKVLENKFDV